MHNDLVIQNPVPTPAEPPHGVATPAAAPQQLMLLFHGVGGNPQDMLALGRRLAGQFPQGLVVSVCAPEPADLASPAAATPGHQWFSAQGISDDNRAARVAAALPGFVERVRQWQQHSGASVESTALIGFSQGAIMALASTQQEGPALAGRVVAFAGRFAGLPMHAPSQTTLHLIHGKQDPVISYAHTVQAAERLVALAADITADVLPFLGHSIAPAMEDLLLERLTTYLPRRRWEEAMRQLQQHDAAG